MKRGFYSLKKRQFSCGYDFCCTSTAKNIVVRTRILTVQFLYIFKKGDLMNSNIGKLQATLSDTAIDKIDNLLEILNNNIMPSEKLKAEDVHIRCMYIVSEELNSYGGKFPLEELYKIKDKIIDSPVLVGHQKDQLPIGRNFYAEVLFKENTHWVKSYFYWMKTADNADDLQKNIDGGIIKECSIGFTFLTPECSICKADIRTCRHEPFGSYSINGNKQNCFFYYKDVDKVLETSMVYRGAIPNTSISNELVTKRNISDLHKIEEIHSLETLDDKTTYLITPRYDGIDVVLNSSMNSIEIHPLENLNISQQILNKLFKEYPKNLSNRFAQLVGFRGKERCSKEELSKFLRGEQCKVKRAELRLFPNYELMKSNYQNIKNIRYKIASKEEIKTVALSIMTKDGIRIFSADELPENNLGLHYKPADIKNINRTECNPRYAISYKGTDMVLSLYTKTDEKHFLVRRFLKQKFMRGNKFIAEKIESVISSSIKNSQLNSGSILLITEENESMQVSLGGAVIENIIIQPMLIHKKEKFLFYKTSSCN